MTHLIDEFREHPGLLFVAATLVPLLSFVLIQLASAAWCAVRPFRDTPGGAALFNLFGGEERGRTPAYVAVGAIALAFVLSLTGFILFTHEQRQFETKIRDYQKELVETKAQDRIALPAEDRERVEKRVKELEEEIEGQEKTWEKTRLDRWQGNVDWLRLHPAGLNDPQAGTALQLGYKIDSLSAVMFVMVTFIATLIHLFSMGYMADELQPEVEDHQVHTAHGHLHRRGRFGRFFMYLSLFCFSMLNLVLADNLFQVFLSWELVGVCSYLLVGFYFERQSASNAANKAFITNRIGDAGFILGLLILWTSLGTFNFDEIFKRVRSPLSDSHGETLQMGGRIVRGELEPPMEGKAYRGLNYDPKGSEVVLFPRVLPSHYHGIGEDAEESVYVYDAPPPDKLGHMPYWMLVAAGLGIFLGCVGKSAQFPLHVWLPDAMEGPTPVSALIHAATMVAAGVYLVGRTYPLFTSEALLVIAYTGGITLFVAATIAVVMTDIKKVLAYSTVSQLGYMMLALGVGGWVAGLFHLVTHAFFKALLFLGSGSVIYGCHHEQDMLKMGGLFPKMRITALTMLAGVLAIAGIPLFTGWYSKDAILAQALGFINVHPKHLLLFILPLATAGLTAFYMARMWLMTFTGKPRDEHVYEHAHESPWLMTVPLILLAGCSVCVAWGWPVYDAEASWLQANVHHAQHHAVLADFGNVDFAESAEHGEYWVVARKAEENERLYAHHNHHLAGNLALMLVAIGLVFAGLIYWKRVLDPAEAKEQFPRLHAFLTDKWRFDWLYSVILVRPALVVGHWFRAFDLVVIDGIIHFFARLTVWISKWDGLFDNGVVDGLVNLVGNVTYAVGSRLRNVQTGFLRSYVLFLVLAAVGIFIVLAYFVRMATAG